MNEKETGIYRNMTIEEFLEEAFSDRICVMDVIHRENIKTIAERLRHPKTTASVISIHSEEEIEIKKGIYKGNIIIGIIKSTFNSDAHKLEVILKGDKNNNKVIIDLDDILTEFGECKVKNVFLLT